MKYSLWNWVEPEKRWAYVLTGEVQDVRRLRRMLYATAKPGCAFAIRRGGDVPEQPPKYVTVAGKPAPGFRTATRLRSAHERPRGSARSLSDTHPP